MNNKNEEFAKELNKLLKKYDMEESQNGEIIEVGEEESEEPYLEKIQIIRKKRYNPNYKEKTRCICGHSYHRHFDFYDDYFDEGPEVGCKYCGCSDYVPFKENLNVKATFTVKFSEDHRYPGDFGKAYGYIVNIDYFEDEEFYSKNRVMLYTNGYNVKEELDRVFEGIEKNKITYEIKECEREKPEHIRKAEEVIKRYMENK